MSTVKDKRDRAPNFSARDKEILVDIVSKYRNIIENNRTDGTTSCQKDQTWQIIEEEFNPLVTIKRSAKNLKSCYENLKKTSKKNASKDKVKKLKTGDGPSEDNLDETGAKVLGLLGPRGNPLPNPFDSDAAYNEEESNITFGLVTGQELVIQTGEPADSGDEMGIVEETLPDDEVVDAIGHQPIKDLNAWRGSWKARRRPALKKNTLQEKRISATLSVGSLADSKKEYYKRLLEMAEKEHAAKMELLKVKTNYYRNKSRLILPD